MNESSPSFVIFPYAFKVLISGISFPFGVIIAQPYRFGYHLEEEQVTDASLSTVMISFQIVKSIVDNGIIVSQYLVYRHRFFLSKSPSTRFYVLLRDYMLETGMIEPYAEDLLTHCLDDFKGYFEGNQQLVQQPREFFCCIHRCFRLEDELAAMEAIAFQESMDESVPRLIAATQEAIQALQITETEVGCDDPCMICLEELEPSTTVIKRMPCCSHLFHGDCIEQWLNTSHLCPWCRFPMPTSAEED